MATDNNELVVAAIFASSIEANIAMGMLRANGIACVLNGEIARNVLGIQLSPADSIRLLVKQQDLDAAQKLLEHDGDI